MKPPANSRIIIKVLLWLLIAVYTYNLPNARVVYNFLVETIGQELTGKIPLILVAATGLIYTALLLVLRRSLKNLLFLIPCGVIAYMIITLEPNPNKHIHIPEYVLMAWLLFAVLSMDYKSADLFFLIFLLTSLLGVVDELEQGVHPARFYGWSDMLVNSASALIGVFTIMGLKTMKAPDYGWMNYFRENGWVVWLIVFGILSSTLMSFFLFRVQAAEIFFGVYPTWLLVLNFFFTASAFLTIILTLVKRNDQNSDEDVRIVVHKENSIKIAKLWMVPSLAIFIYMNLLLFYVAVSGSEFL
ncbi:MAG: hypothetical protein FJZ98_04895 [Chloroflexi bacterium]|nr:hypothetical protein [Chloroflexota bacterium]